MANNYYQKVINNDTWFLIEKPNGDKWSIAVDLSGQPQSFRGVVRTNLNGWTTADQVDFDNVKQRIQDYINQMQ